MLNFEDAIAMPFCRKGGKVDKSDGCISPIPEYWLSYFVPRGFKHGETTADKLATVFLAAEFLTVGVYLFTFAWSAR